MLAGLGSLVRALDPRLKMGIALSLGPSLWLLSPLYVALCAIILLGIVLALVQSQPLGRKMVRSLFSFVLIWVGIKCVLDVMSGLPLSQVAVAGGILGLRLVALLLLGLSLALSSSARALGLALSWAVRPFVGRERAWKLALSLALMVHFLPLCLSTMNEVRETMSRRCPRCGLKQRMLLIPQAVLRNLGQKTWNQTLAVAGRGLESGDAWQPDFAWQLTDTIVFVIALSMAAGMFLL